MPIFTEKPKWILKSKTIIGAILMVLPVILGPIGFDFTFIQEFLGGALDEGSFTIGTLLNIAGRYTANSKVTLWPPGDGG
ncbi:hypothetical protein LCGC14_0939130 [marine sediment metagenome]|uniref:Uncharacterized protein n=1 Tax=marine sediment metagenome TaxID=412755 RepID=A0A0F9NQ96_9ZZZZ